MNFTMDLFKEVSMLAKHSDTKQMKLKKNLKRNPSYLIKLLGPNNLFVLNIVKNAFFYKLYYTTFNRSGKNVVTRKLDGGGVGGFL